MEILIYNELDYSKVKKQFNKVLDFLKAGDFKSADVKKMVNTGFYRAKLDDTNRLLFKYTQIEGKKYLLLMEVILNHAYEKSRFLNGVQLDENKLQRIDHEKMLDEADAAPVSYVNPRQKHFHILDKILSFDTIQEEVFQLPSPLIIIGSAGSGKTALTLEKMKTLPGKILYTTLSAFLVENSHNLYYALGYENEKQEVDFMSFNEFLSSIEVPQGKEIDYRAFEQWIWRFKQSHKIKDAYKVYEEFKGVITGAIVDKPHLSKEDYLNLGVKQSIFLDAERPAIYDLFTRYVDFLNEGAYYDSNMLAHQYLSKVKKQYDFIVIDEVQDITNIQLYLILNTLLYPGNFILCGDSNQIVHPNFFSWSNIKSLFYKQDLQGNIIRVLATNYRNTPEVTQIANQLLLVKNARFGSIDKESTYLVKSNSKHKGEVKFYENKPKVKQDLNQRTRRSAKFAVVVMRNEEKDEARKFFESPLLFSIHEVKGLEYENVILYNIISNYEKEFRELTVGVRKEDLKTDNIEYARSKDKSDKSLDEYKFYVNSLYVAMTRAVKNLYVIEAQKKHALLDLLELTNFSEQVEFKEQNSSAEEWQREAHRLEMQGKTEQAQSIRQQILQIQPVPWEVTTREEYEELVKQALNPDNFNKKAKDRLFEFDLFYGNYSRFPELSALKYRPADKGRWEKEGLGKIKRKYTLYTQDNLKQLLPLIQKYGLDFRDEFNLTPFMLAVIYGAEQILHHLIENGAKTDLVDNFGRTALQILLSKAKEDTKTKHILNRFYVSLKSESIKVKIDNKLVKIDSHQAEYLMLNFMVAVYQIHKTNYKIVFDKERRKHPLYESADFLKFFEGLTHQVLPEYRMKRTYITSILAKNEINSTNAYSKKLFLRARQGMYMLNPSLELWIEEKWISPANLAWEIN
ncbi:MAG: 3'-5' exonuclease [Microscillaceae bacterium]|nr:3'-5' exonuclease [Microscillaceae bacterium]